MDRGLLDWTRSFGGTSFIIAHGNGQGFLEGARDIFTVTALYVIEQDTPTIGAVLTRCRNPAMLPDHA